MLRSIELRDANAFVAATHRHHKPVQGHRFSLSAWDGGELVGVAIVGRPVSREVDKSTTVEVTRLATNGHKNACSFLYGAAARAAKALGYALIQTYILATEPGTSLAAAGWKVDGIVEGRKWDRYAEVVQVRLDGETRRTDQPMTDKIRYVKVLRATLAQEETPT